MDNRSSYSISLRSNDPNSIRPDAQHTTGGFECAFTGNASSASDGLGTNDVDGGHTTLFSPIYNLSNYTTCVFVLQMGIQIVLIVVLIQVLIGGK